MLPMVPIPGHRARWEECEWGGERKGVWVCGGVGVWGCGGVGVWGCGGVAGVAGVRAWRVWGRRAKKDRPCEGPALKPLKNGLTSPSEP